VSVSYIPEKVKIRLWGKAAGRCEYEGCNQPLWIDTTTRIEFNTAYIAHIIGDTPGGPRGDPVFSDMLKSDLSNLMLLCDVHHRLIDKEDERGHPPERLRRMKKVHEDRIGLLGSIGPEKKSHIVLYGANIGIHSSPLSFSKAAVAMVPEWFPAEATPIALGMVNSSLVDHDELFWRVESAQLHSMISQQIRPRLAQGTIQHLSIFGLAPQPLLMLLGFGLSDIPAAQVYQLHREPPGSWAWQDHPPGFDYIVESPPASEIGPPALVFSLSATVTDKRIRAVLPNAAIWKIVSPAPNNDFLKSSEQAERFRQIVRTLMDQIKARHGQDAVIHVFPAMPVALAIDFGRIIMPKADLALKIYDENRDKGGFVHAIDLNTGFNS
jgi:hypothetical protein